MRDTSLGSEGTQPLIRPPKPKVLVSGRKVPITSGGKNQCGLERWKKLRNSLREPKRDLGLMQTHSLWAPALWQQLEGHQWHTGRNWSIWHQGKCSGVLFTRPFSQYPLSLFWADSTQRNIAETHKLHQPGSCGLSHPGNYLRLCPIQLMCVLFYNRPCY